MATGSAILTAAIQSSTVSQISVLSRKPPYDTSSKINYIQLPSEEYPKGFDEIPASLIEKLKKDGYESCIWELGVSQNAFKEENIKITHDYAITAAKALSQLGTSERPFRFIFMSGGGAKQDESGYASYTKIKGRTEKHLNELRSDNLDILNIRPGAIIPTPEHRQRMPWRLGQGFRLSNIFLNPIIPSLVIQSSGLGRVCVGLAQGKGWDNRDEEGVMENTILKQMAQDWN